MWPFKKKALNDHEIHIKAHKEAEKELAKERTTERPKIPSAALIKELLDQIEDSKYDSFRAILAGELKKGIHPFVSLRWTDMGHMSQFNETIDFLTPELEAAGYEVIKKEHIDSVKITIPGMAQTETIQRAVPFRIIQIKGGYGK